MAPDGIPSWVGRLPLQDRSRLEEAVNFLRNITPEDKVGILYDDDGDGLSAAASVIIGVIRLRGNAPEWVQPFGHSSSFIDDALVRRIKGAGLTKLISVDRSIEQKPTSFLQEMESVCPILVIDHHKVYNEYSSPRFIVLKPQIVWETESSSFPTAILAHTLFSMVVDMRDKDWIPCIGITSDSAYASWKSFVDASAKKWGLNPVKDDPFAAPFGIMSSIIYCTQILSSYQLSELLGIITNASHPNELLNSGFRSLVSVIEDEINEWMDRAERELEKEEKIELILSSVRPKHAIKSLLINKLSRKYPHYTVIMLQDVANGTRVTLSARRQDFRIPVNDLLEKSIAGLSDANAGGHIPSAGGSIRKEDESLFLANLRKYLTAFYAKEKSS
ncbi:MAG: DHH family phosphoesterase [Candidatus Diapherotrites archaeon]